MFEQLLSQDRIQRKHGTSRGQEETRDSVTTHVLFVT